MNFQAAPSRGLGRFKIRLKGTVVGRPLTSPASVGQSSGVKTLEELTAKYGLAPADELAGPDSGRVYIDYGRPVVLADSSRAGSQRTKREDALWSRALKR